MEQTTGRTFTLSADGDTAEVEVHGACHFHVSGTFGGGCHFHVSGTFGGGTCKLQIEDNDGTFRDIANASHTAAADQIVRFPQRARSLVKANLSGATTPSLTVMIRGEIF
jgi:hypothetical protein